MLILIDNYDSFVHNLARYCNELGCATQVIRNDAMSAEQILDLKPRAIVVSPGPCTPDEAGICQSLVRCAADAGVPLLGVCLGHQAIGSALGGNVIRAARPVHGNTAIINHSESGLFAGIPSPLRVMRYHSLMIEEASLPNDLVVTARTQDGVVMAIAHQRAPLFGVQFHPESVLTECGHDLLANFLRIAGLRPETPARADLQAEVDQSLWDQGFAIPASRLLG